MKLFPHLAAIFAHSITNTEVIKVYHQMQEKVANMDFSMNDIMHHFSSGLKAV
jgi:hypothetical protein